VTSIRHFFGMVATVARSHPVLFTVTVIAIPLVLGGLVWKLVGLVSRVPVAGQTVADAARKVASATGSA
jgi:hypothetical protein